MAAIDGTGGDDVLNGTVNGDVINGLGGDDTITENSGGADTVNGGDGNDTITIYRDTLITGNFTVDGGDGNDRLKITGGTNVSVVGGGAGNDFIDVTNSNATVYGGAGDDIFVINRLVTLHLDGGSDTVRFAGLPVNGSAIVGPSVIYDFTPGDGGDRLDFGAIFSGVLVNWDQASNPFGTYLRFSTLNATLMALEYRTSPTSNDWNRVAYFTTFDTGALTAFNLGGYSPDGTAVTALTINGTTGDDQIAGGVGNDTLTGFDGNDMIVGGAGNDTIDGGLGNDAIDGGMGNDTIQGGDGNDIITDAYGFAGQIDGGMGNDTILLDLSVNTHPSGQPIGGALFNRTVAGGGGDDTITAIGKGGNYTNFAINGGTGNDVIELRNTRGTVDAGDGDDLIVVDIRNGLTAQLTLGAGTDIVRIGNFPSSASDTPAPVHITDLGTTDVFDLPDFLTRKSTAWDFASNPFGSGVAQLQQSGADVLVNVGTWTVAVIENRTIAQLTAANFGGYAPDGSAPANQTLTGDADPNTLAGGPGNDLVQGLGGNDMLIGGFGNDQLQGGDGDDSLYGGYGNDTLDGGNNNDHLEGGQGNDTLNGGGGDDYLDGGDGVDTLDGGAGNDTLVNTGSGADTLRGGDGNDTLTNNGGIAFLLDGGIGNDVISGGAQTIDGGDGDDTITATGINGIVLGGAGNDRISSRAWMMVDAGNGDDIVTITSGSSRMGDPFNPALVTVGAGHDIVVAGVTFAWIRVLDFMTGSDGDQLDLSIFGANPFAPGGVLLVNQDGADTVITRRSGTPSDYLNIRLVGVDATQLSQYNLNGIDTGFYNPTVHDFGGTAGDDSFTGGDANDTIRGLGGSDTLSGAGGNDLIQGDDGNDTLYGGIGNDTLYGGNDTDYLDGGAGDDILSGDAGNDVLVGGAGNDFLSGGTGADAMWGGGGDDAYIVGETGDTILEAAGEGRDAVYTSVDYALAAGVEIEILSAASQAATDPLLLTGNEFAQTLYGNAGANRLDGGGGADVLSGLGGDDVYIVDNAGDFIVEGAGQGNDSVFASVDYRLTAGAQVELLSAAVQAGTDPLSLIGNEFAQTIYGNAGANRLEGGGGADLLAGLGGDDTYVITSGSEVVWEAAGQGTDVVYASVSYSLAAGMSVEILSTGAQGATDAINLTGNEFAQTLYGNAGSNALDGGGGADLLVGLGGDDAYYVDDAGDFVFEAGGQGRDVVYSTVSYALAAGQSVEVLATNWIGGTSAIDLTGNEFTNEIYGNAGSNTINGGGGADFILGMGGADSFAFTTAIGPGTGNVDTILDFGADDRVILDHNIFTGLAAGALAAGAFAVGSAAQDADDRIIYNDQTGALMFDADGAGGAAAITFAMIGAGQTLHATDFSVI